LLARQLRSAHQVKSQFLVCDPAWEGETEIEGFQIERLQARRAAALVEKLSTSAPRIVLLHYVGYGYENRGCPLWLKQGLKVWRRRNASRRLIIMFHELYAFGAPWRSSFWMSYPQQLLAVGLARLADRCVTNLHRYALWLGSRAKQHRDKIITIPVFSNVGEGLNGNPLDTRPPNMVIFGGTAWVEELLGKHSAQTYFCCKALGIERIITIGSPVGTAPKSTPVPIEERGFLKADQVAEVIRSSRVGMMNYFPGYLGKSGVYAAYSALGAVPLLPQINPSILDGCIDGKTYLSANQITKRPANELLQQVASNAREWYETHNLSKTAEVYARVLGEIYQDFAC
jgi:hypothetical protein